MSEDDLPRRQNSATGTLDRLLTTLDVRIHAFALCEIKSGWRLAFEPLEAVTIHYILAGAGSIHVGAGLEAAYTRHSLIVVPARLSQSLGQASETHRAVDAGESCRLLADGLLKFTAGSEGDSAFVVCATISASYGGALGLFDGIHGPVVVDVSGSALLRGAFDLMLAEMARPGIGTKALTEALMKQCLILVLREQLTSLGVRSPFYTLLLDPRLARAVVAILENPAGVHTVGRLAALAGMSRSSFAARFAELFEQTPMEFVQRVRLRLGADLLQATELPIKLIAGTVGYANRSHFTRSFQAAHGIDPRTYRERSARNEEASQFARAPALTDRLAGAVDALLGDEADDEHA